MATIINASPTNGLTQTADGSGQIKLQSNGVTTNALAWVNFDGTLTGTITPRASYNITSVVKSATGTYTLNFSNTLSDANYVMVGSSVFVGGYTSSVTIETTSQSSSACNIVVLSYNASGVDRTQVQVAIFGN